jgi:hypothetical protein
MTMKCVQVCSYVLPNASRPWLSRVSFTGTSTTKGPRCHDGAAKRNGAMTPPSTVSPEICAVPSSRATIVSA